MTKPTIDEIKESLERLYQFSYSESCHGVHARASIIESARKFSRKNEKKYHNLAMKEKINIIKLIEGYANGK
jgi:hypothetical protein